MPVLKRLVPCGGGRVLMLSTVMLAAVAAAVLAAGAQDAHLLRLGLVAALWAALLAAFAAARMRREISVGVSHAEQLRTAYQLELEREVAARREHTLTVERELREQVERGEIAALRAELVAMRASLEKLVGGDPRGERVALRPESARLVPMPAHPRKSDDSLNLRFGPGRRYRPELDTHARPAAHHNGSHHNGSGTQRSVSDLLAAHGADSPPRRRRGREDGPQAATGA